MGLKLFSRNPKNALTRSKKKKRSPASKPAEESVKQPFRPSPITEWHEDELRRMCQQQRFASILRDVNHWSSNPDAADLIEQAKQHLEGQMALVPAGNVSITQTLSAQPGDAEQEIEVEPFLLDVHTVTNARFQAFVDDGGYDQLDYWPEEIWPHLIELKDRTGQPSPRFWENGRHDVPLTDHPVTGLSWYEAQAFALWIGQRLVTEAEWQMAASWHIVSSADIMRRFPWGDAMDKVRCNIWASRKGGTVPVTDYPNGAAPNQVQQLVGNVWEWTDSEYNPTDDRGQPIVGEMPMHAVRGGAFDTYFETQTSSEFRTGQIALSRTHNTGFRCAMDLNAATWMNEG